MAKKETIKERVEITAPTKDKKLVEVLVKWNTPDSVITRFATNTIVQLMEHEVKISFFEVKPEIRLDTSEPLPKEVNADCVASIMMSPERLPALIDVLQRQFKQYESRKDIKA